MITYKQIGDYLYDHRTAIIKNGIAAVLIFLILIIEGCINFVDMEFHWENLRNWSLWVQIATKVLLLVLIRMACMFIFLDVARKTNKRLGVETLLNEKLLKTRGNDFPYYCENVKNREIKKEAFTKKIQKKLATLERRAKTKDRMLYFSLHEGDQYLKEKNKYCIKRKMFEEMLTDEYQEKNYFCLDVKHYARIDPAVFDLPISIRNENKYQLTSKTKSAIGLSIMSAAFILVMVQTIWNATNTAPKEELPVIALTIGILMDTLFIAWQTIQGITGAFNTINNQEVTPYCNRNRILKEYGIWRNPDKVDNMTKWIEQLENAARQETEKLMEKENTNEEDVEKGA